jgi:hypothetical protein
MRRVEHRDGQGIEQHSLRSEESLSRFSPFFRSMIAEIR